VIVFATLSIAAIFPWKGSPRPLLGGVPFGGAFVVGPAAPAASNPGSPVPMGEKPVISIENNAATHRIGLLKNNIRSEINLHLLSSPCYQALDAAKP